MLSARILLVIPNLLILCAKKLDSPLQDPRSIRNRIVCASTLKRSGDMQMQPEVGVLADELVFRTIPK